MWIHLLIFKSIFVWSTIDINLLRSIVISILSLFVSGSLFNESILARSAVITLSLSHLLFSFVAVGWQKKKMHMINLSTIDFGRAAYSWCKFAMAPETRQSCTLHFCLVYLTRQEKWHISHNNIVGTASKCLRKVQVNLNTKKHFWLQTMACCSYQGDLTSTTTTILQGTKQQVWITPELDSRSIPCSILTNLLDAS